MDDGVIWSELSNARECFQQIKILESVFKPRKDFTLIKGRRELVAAERDVVDT